MASLLFIGIGDVIRRVNAEESLSGVYRARGAVVGTIIDILAAPTLIAIGILGTLAILPLSPAASYAMIAGGTLCAFPHLGLSIYAISTGKPPLSSHCYIFSEALSKKE